MRTKILTLLVALTAAVSIASLVDTADASGGGGCCICLGLSNNTVASTSGFPGGPTCTNLAAGGEINCNEICSGDSEFLRGISCSDPSLAETCRVPMMAPASSATGLTALAAALAGFGAFYLRRRSS